MHEELKKMFNPKDSKLAPGEKFGGTTTTLSTKEFSDYCERIKYWASIEHGIMIPEVDNDKKEN